MCAVSHSLESVERAEIFWVHYFYTNTHFTPTLFTFSVQAYEIETGACYDPVTFGDTSEFLAKPRGSEQKDILSTNFLFYPAKEHAGIRPF